MILYQCSDLIFASKIRSTAESLGFLCRPARDIASLTDRLEQVDDGRGAAPVLAVLVDLDLGDAALDTVRAVKAFDSDLPCVAFGPHVQTALLQSARDAGAQFVMPRSVFSANLPDILARFSREAS